MITSRNLTSAKRRSGSGLVGQTVKRGLDVILSLTGLMLLLPLFGVLAVCIRRDSPGPVFYRGRRAARGEGTFGILKFRTMYERPSSYEGAKVTAHDDARITRVGRWLRDTKLNELPQLWNVLIGEMSLVGPRPEDPDIAADWPEPARREILSVRPGITSPASVLYRNEEELLTSGREMGDYLKSIAPCKMRLDQLYVRQQSFWLDWDVIFWTLLLVILRLGKYHLPVEQIFWGPISRLMCRYMSWLSVDFLITFTAFGLSGLFWRSLGPLHIGWLNAIGISLAFAMLFSMTGAVLGIHRIAWSKASASDVLDLVPAMVIAVSVTWWINRSLDLAPQRMILLAWGLASSGIVIARYRTRLVTGLVMRWLSFRVGLPSVRERVLVVGGGKAGQHAAEMLNGLGLWTYHVVGFVDDDLSKRRLRIRGVKVLGSTEDISELVQEHDVGILVFAIHNVCPKERQALLDLCCHTGTRVVLMPDFFGTLESIRGQDHRTALAPEFVHVPDPSARTAKSVVCASRLQSWLAELELTALRGDVLAVHSKIKQMQTAFLTDVAPPNVPVPRSHEKVLAK